MQGGCLPAVKDEVGGQTCRRRGRIKVKVGIQCDITLRLAIIDKVLDVDSAVTVSIAAVPVDVNISIDHTAGLVKHRYDAGPLLKAQVIDDELHVLGVGTRQACRHQFHAAAVALQHEVGVNHACPIIHIHIIVIIECPMSIADYRVIAEQSHAHLIIGQAGITSQTITCFMLDILLVQHEVYCGTLEAAFHIHLGKLVPCTWSVPHVGVEGKILVV